MRRNALHKEKQMTAEDYAKYRRMAGTDVVTGAAIGGANHRHGPAAPPHMFAAGEAFSDVSRMGFASARDTEAAQIDDVPIWLAALIASRCRASANGEGHAVSWICISGRAYYTNAGADAETIQPLGVRLERGRTLSVSWAPGETEYTLEIFGGLEHCA